uniref:Uncharacterized protein n=1 Tax=Rangifer tarandus platyrhynchus TaxID=3082113 RepID=A0ACB0EAI2_RANTA|nr:unnamed protein product [Rangifer tarandus platyrhynchus]
MPEIKRGRGARLGPAPRAGGLGSCPFSTGLARSIALSPRQDLPAFAVLGHAASGGPRLAHSTPSQPGLFRVSDTCHMCALQRQRSPFAAEPPLCGGWGAGRTAAVPGAGPRAIHQGGGAPDWPAPAPPRARAYEEAEAAAGAADSVR